MTQAIYPISQPDYIPFDFQSVHTYGCALRKFAEKRENQYLYIDGTQIKFVGVLQKLLQVARGFFGLTDHTSEILIHSVTLKLLYHGETQGFLTNKKVLKYIKNIEVKLKNESCEEYEKPLQNVVQQIYDAIKNKTSDHSKRLTDLKNALKAFHEHEIVQLYLTPSWFERLFLKPFKNISLTYFGDIHLKLAKRYEKKRDYARALQQYIRAEKIQNLDQEYQSLFIDRFVAFINHRKIFTFDCWQNNLLPIIHSLVKRAFTDQRYEDAEKCLWIALRYIPKENHSLKFQYCKTLYYLDTLHEQSFDFEYIILKEINECKNKLINPGTAKNEYLNIKENLVKLYKMVGNSLMKRESTQKNFWIYLRSVKYQEKALRIVLQLNNEELYELYESACKKILSFAGTPNVSIVEHLIKFLKKIKRLKQDIPVKHINHLIKICQNHELSALAQDLVEKAQQEWPSLNEELSKYDFSYSK